MSPQVLAAKGHHAAPEPDGSKVHQACLYETAQSWVTGLVCPKAMQVGQHCHPTSGLKRRV